MKGLLKFILILILIGCVWTVIGFAIWKFYSAPKASNSSLSSSYVSSSEQGSSSSSISSSEDSNSSSYIDSYSIVDLNPGAFPGYYYLNDNYYLCTDEDIVVRPASGMDSYLLIDGNVSDVQVNYRNNTSMDIVKENLSLNYYKHGENIYLYNLITAWEGGEPSYYYYISTSDVSDNVKKFTLYKTDGTTDSIYSGVTFTIRNYTNPSDTQASNLYYSVVESTDSYIILENIAPVPEDVDLRLGLLLSTLPCESIKLTTFN